MLFKKTHQERGEKLLKTLSKGTYWDFLLKERQRPKYNSTDIEFLPVLNTEPDQSGKPILLDLSYEKLKGGCPIVIFSAMSAGKTVFEQNLMDEMNKVGYLTCNVFDVKSDFYSCRKPLQEKFLKFLPSWKKPRPLPIKAYIPQYINDIAHKSSKRPQGMEIGQIQFEDITSDDLINSVFNLKPEDSGSALIRRMWRNPPKNRAELADRLTGNFLAGISEFTEAGVTTKFRPDTVTSIARRIEDIAVEGLVGDRHLMNFSQDMAGGNIPCLCLQGYGETKLGYTQALVASVCRNIYSESTNKDGVLFGKRKAVFIGDAGKILPPKPSNPSCKEPIIYNFSKVGRQYDIFTVVDAQNVSDVDEEIIKAARYIVGLKLMSPPDLQKLWDIKGIDPTTFEDIGFTPKPRRIDTGNLAGAREVIIWDVDRPDRPIRGWSPCPSCSIHEVGS